ncbi:MAG TPA: EAL domain-containing protein [Solirubrobacteraceae bacterium]|nr:EAL domain-containing protein [Solirubrobacteraceae bacterium]
MTSEPAELGSFRDLIDELPALVWVATPDGRIEWRNATAEGFSGLPIETVVADQFAPVHPDDKLAVQAFLEGALAAGEPFETEFRSLRSDGEYRWALLRARPVRDDLGQVRRWVAIVSDIDEQRRALTVLETLFSEVPVGLSFADRDFRVVRINKAGAALRHLPADRMLGRTLAELWPDVWPELEPLYRRVLDRGEAVVNIELAAEWPTSPGELRHWLISVYPVRDRDEVIGIGWVAVDVTERKRAEIRLRHLADHDSLTGVYNRRRLIEELDRHLRYATRSRRSGAVLVFDVDHLKFANDTYGHATGDAIIKAVADVLQARIRRTDVVARQGGDEFAVILPEATPAEALVVARDVRVLLDEQQIGAPIKISIGIAPFTGEEEITADEILVCADAALYEAKERGGNQARVYTGQASGVLTWVQRIRTALAEDRFVLFGQPIIDLRTGSTVRRELLVRMVADEGEIVQPSSFIPTAERFGLIHEIDRWVTAEGLRLALEGERIAINLSGYSIGEQPIIRLVQSAIADGLNPANVSFEITETAAMTNLAAARAFVGVLADLGCAVALDDFGTGFGSFAYLKQIPARYLKIDIEFVRNLTTDETDRHVVQAIVGIAHSLGKLAVAEGVENPDTLAVLRAYEVDHAQGFHLGMPEPLARAR